MTPEERFWSRVDKAGDCWTWNGYRDDEGYGRFYIDRGRRRVLAHRWAYEQLVGLIPEGLTVDHLCRNTSCVNPAHMEPVTNRENVLRGNCGAAANARKTHCLRGHPFDAANTILRRGGRRACRACQNKSALYEEGRRAGWAEAVKALRDRDRATKGWMLTMAANYLDSIAKEGSRDA